MELRLKNAEMQIKELLKHKENIDGIHSSLAESMKTIASSLVSFEKFQMKTEIHRQDDEKFKTSIMSKVDKLGDKREADLDAIYRQLRKEKDHRIDLIHKQDLLDIRLELSEKEVTMLVKQDADSVKFWKSAAITLLTGIIIASITFFFVSGVTTTVTP